MQVLVSEVVGIVVNAVLLALLSKNLTAPPLPRNVPRGLAHGKLLRQALAALPWWRRQ
jgi:hypothetical protein